MGSPGALILGQDSGAEQSTRDLYAFSYGWLDVPLGLPSSAKLCNTRLSGFMGFVKIFRLNPAGFVQKEHRFWGFTLIKGSLRSSSLGPANLVLLSYWEFS